MLSFFKNRNRDNFEERAKRQQVWNVLRRVIDTRSPMERSDEYSDRNFNRYNRCVPVAIFDANALEPAAAIFAATKDFSDNGLSFVSADTVDIGEVVCALWNDEPILLLGMVRRQRPFGGGLVEIGIEFTEILESTEVRHALAPAVALLNTEAALTV